MANTLLASMSEENAEKGAPRWIVSLADLLSLLLIFFILLFAMSSTNMTKYDQTVKSMQESLLTKKELSQLKKSETEKLRDIEKTLNESFINENMGSDVKASFENNSVRIIMKDSILFQSGEADLLPTAVPVIKAIMYILKDKSYKIRVEGHTDDIPIETEKYPSNWELSSARASNVVKFIIHEGQLDPKLLVAQGMAEFHPISTNDSDENRAKNRRVEIKISQE